MSRIRKGPTVPGFRTYVDKAGQHRWRLVAGNGQVIAVPGEGFTRHADCIRSIETVRALIADPSTGISRTKARR